VNVRVVLDPGATVAAPNALAITGGERTVNVTVLLVAPAPLCVDETAPVVLILFPAVVPVTFTPKVHEALAASVAALRPRLELPAVAVMVPPPQIPVAPFGVLTTKPAGRASANDTPLSEEPALGLVTVKLREVKPFSGIVAAPNALTMVGGVATDRLADAVFPVPPLVELTFPVVLV
jgi:hypothetical protein